MSDSSSLSSIGHSDKQLEKALRDGVQKVFSTGNLENLTVKRVRATVERDLDLRDGYFKETRWKDRSKAIIEAEAKNNEDESTITNAISTPQTGSSQQQPPSLAPEKDQLIKKRKVFESIERDDEEVTRPGKRKAQSRVVLEDDEDVLQASLPSKVDKVHRGMNGHVAAKGNPSPSSDAPTSQAKALTTRTEDELGDSDLSEVFDEDPKPRRKKTASKPSKPGSKKFAQAKSKDVDPQAEEIKSLQGWLVKCGVRKVWGKELKPYETSREKIKHLKGMLSDVGMTDRYSKEKAESIREARELAADLEAVQEGAKLWGKGADSGGRASRARLTENALSEFDYMDQDDSDGTE